MEIVIAAAVLGVLGIGAYVYRERQETARERERAKRAVIEAPPAPAPEPVRVEPAPAPAPTPAPQPTPTPVTAEEPVDDPEPESGLIPHYDFDGSYFLYVDGERVDELGPAVQHYKKGTVYPIIEALESRSIAKGGTIDVEFVIHAEPLASAVAREWLKQELSLAGTKSRPGSGRLNLAIRRAARGVQEAHDRTAGDAPPKDVIEFEKVAVVDPPTRSEMYDQGPWFDVTTHGHRKSVVAVAFPGDEPVDLRILATIHGMKPDVVPLELWIKFGMVMPEDAREPGHSYITATMPLVIV